jgi:hypothetical protein
MSSLVMLALRGPLGGCCAAATATRPLYRCTCLLPYCQRRPSFMFRPGRPQPSLGLPVLHFVDRRADVRMWEMGQGVGVEGGVRRVEWDTVMNLAQCVGM